MWFFYGLQYLRVMQPTLSHLMGFTEENTALMKQEWLFQEVVLEFHFANTIISVEHFKQVCLNKNYERILRFLDSLILSISSS